MIEPLTPPDCDLRDFAYMPMDAARLLDSDFYALSTAEEFKAALTLWFKCWAQVPAASLPNDDRVLAHLSGAGAKWKKVKDMALRGFILCSDGRLYHSVVAEKANDAWAKRQSFRERSKKGNSKRWGSLKDDQQQSQTDPLAILEGVPEGVLELPKGEGEGEREGKKPPNPLLGEDDDYPFFGQVARLNRRDYHAWRKQFHAIPDFDAELAAFDSWLTAQTEAKRKNWFGSAAPWLAKRHQENLTRQRTGPKPVAVGV